MYAEAFQAFVPIWGVSQDRGEVLADAFVTAWDGSAIGSSQLGLLRQPFREVMASLAATQKRKTSINPAIYLNATAVHSGRRIIASNVQLGRMFANPLFFDAGVSRGKVLLTDRTSVIAAALHSARFPVISPPGLVMACDPSLKATHGATCGHGRSVIGRGLWDRLVDGGYFENSGLETLRDVLRDLTRNGKRSSEVAMQRIFVITISNDINTGVMCRPSPTPRYSPGDGNDPPFSWADEVDSAQRQVFRPLSNAVGNRLRNEARLPFDTLLSVREERAQLELSRTVESLGCSHVLEWSLGEALRHSKREKGASESEASETIPDPPLGWMLSRASLDAMDSGVEWYADALPFDLATCEGSANESRGRLGDNSLPASLCAKFEK